MNYENYIRINTNYLINNIDYFKNKYNYKYYILDVSNNAFGHGMYIINYLKEKIDYLYINNFNDVLLARKYNKDIPIIYSGIINENNIYDLILNNAILLVRNKEIIETILDLNIKESFELILNIDILGYHGINSKHIILDILKMLESQNKIHILGIKSKIAEKEYDELRCIISPLKNLELVILNNESDKNKIKLSNAIKLDSSIYGFQEMKKGLFKKAQDDVKQIFTLNSKVTRITTIRKNKKEMYLATIPFGYLNGMNDNIDKVFIQKQLYTIKDIYEDYTLVNVDKEIHVDDQVEIISSNNPLDHYLSNNALENIGTFSSNLPILYDDYALEKVFFY